MTTDAACTSAPLADAHLAGMCNDVLRSGVHALMHAVTWQAGLNEVDSHDQMYAHLLGRQLMTPVAAELRLTSGLGSGFCTE